MDKFIQTVRENDFHAEEIDKVIVYLRQTSPCDETLETHEDLFINLRYQMACIANGIPVSRWHFSDIMNSPKVREFFPKVIFERRASGTPEADETGTEVFVKGESFKAIGNCVNGVCTIRRISEEELTHKFDENSKAVIPEDKRNELIRTILDLENAEDAARLLRLATP